MSWRLLRKILLMLDVVDAEPLDNYAELIRALDSRYGPKCWFIIYFADVSMRSEYFGLGLPGVLAAGREGGYSQVVGFVGNVFNVSWPPIFVDFESLVGTVNARRDDCSMCRVDAVLTTLNNHVCTSPIFFCRST